MMARVQISLAKEEQKRAKVRADEFGISFAEYIRRLVRADLEETTPPEGIAAIFDLGDSGGSDVARLKDEYVGEALEAEYLRERS
jgi:hypothetical protein